MKPARCSLFDVFLSFLKLGCIAFGGPVAHLGHFQEEYVRKRKWVTEVEYADLVALCQFLPGPASSQVGFAIGYRIGGVPAAFLAWLGFTLPSAILMIGFGLGIAELNDLGGAGWIAGLKLAAVAVVANAIWNMAANLCPDLKRTAIALVSAAVLILMTEALWQIVVIASGAIVGWWLYRDTIGCSDADVERAETKAKRGWPHLFVFALLLIGLPLLQQSSAQEIWAITDGFYRAGSLVFGGGHVVLPLLNAFTVEPGWIHQENFLAGYGAAQALPGPLFAFSGFLGASLSIGPGGIFGGILTLVAVYLPSWLLVLGALPYWERLRRLRAAQAALMGTNAAVVGLLLAAFYNPIWVVAVTDFGRLAFAISAFVLLRFASLPPWLLVLLSAGVGQLCL